MLSAQIDQQSSLANLLTLFERQYTGLTAFEHFGHAYSYSNLVQDSRALAAYFQTLGLEKGSRIAIMLPNCLQYPIILFASWLVGLVVVNVNPLYTSRELRVQLVDSGAEAIVVLSEFTDRLRPILAVTAIRHILVTQLGDLFPRFKGTLLNIILRLKKGWFPAVIEHAFPFKTALAQGRAGRLTPITLTRKELALLQYTGGTTGTPKGAMLSHGNLLSNVTQCLDWVLPHVTPHQERVLLALPLYHIFALTVCCLSFLSMGETVVLVTDPKDISGLIQLLKKRPISFFVGVNTLFNTLIHHSKFNSISWERLKCAIAGGMAVQENIAKQWQQLTGKAVVEGYGLTEASPVLCANPLDTPTFTKSIGFPMTHTELKLVNEYEETVGLGEIGELIAQGPQIMQGYWGKPGETQATLKNGWLHTGDMGYQDKTGRVYLSDRKKDMIKVSGFNVYPTEIENILMSHPSILECGVVGTLDTTGNGVIHAFVVKKNFQLTERELRDFCHRELTGYKVPKFFHFVESLPKSAVGKVLRRVLIEELLP